MAKGDYLTKDPYGEPFDECERAAKKWLIENNGTEGKTVMKSLGDLIRRFRDGAPT